MQINEKVKRLLEQSIAVKSSDLFILPKADAYELKQRTAAGCTLLQNLSREEAKELINYFKYSAQMDISEHRRPQVGAMQFIFQQKQYYLRLSSLGNFNDCESLVIRIIYQIKDSKYYFADQITSLERLAQKRGLIVTSGPTGSGKTTTMYELARKMSKNKIVMTIEDPVEVHEKTFFQAQVNDEAGIAYLDLLKAALRHRPDILIIGEIRDPGTARLAMDAALSGHLVFATVHAKNTFQTISRLEGLGIKNDELTNSLTAISYQRLIPNKNGVACLFDIASGIKLKEQLAKPIREDFVSWRERLNRLYKEERIDAETFTKFQEG